MFICDGKVEADGSFADCVASSGGHIDFVSQNAGADTEPTERAVSEEKQTKNDSIPDKMEKDQVDKIKIIKEATRNDTRTANEQQERKKKGLVSKTTFLCYAKSMGGWLTAIWLLILFILSQATSLASIAMIGRWSERTVEEQVRHSFYFDTMCYESKSSLILLITQSGVLGHLHHSSVIRPWSSSAFFLQIYCVSEAISQGFQAAS